MVGAIAVHDGKALHACTLCPGFGNIGDAAVEEGTLARKARIDEVGAFMRGAAPFGGRDHPAFTHQFVPERDVVEITAHGQIAVRIGAHETVNQHLGRAAFPCAPCGCGNLLIRRSRQRVGADGAEQAIVPEVAIDHARQFQPQCARTRGIGRGGRIGIGGKGWNGDAEVVPGIGGDGHRNALAILARARLRGIVGINVADGRGVEHTLRRRRLHDCRREQQGQGGQGHSDHHWASLLSKFTFTTRQPE